MITGTVVRCGVCCRMESRLEQAREMAVSQPLGVTLKLTWAGSLSGRMRMGGGSYQHVKQQFCGVWITSQILATYGALIPQAFVFLLGTQDLDDPSPKSL